MGLGGTGGPAAAVPARAPAQKDDFIAGDRRFPPHVFGGSGGDDRTDFQPLGRVAVKVADILRGKIKPEFTPNADCGDFVIIINTDKVVLTGNKLEKKTYYHHSGYAGGLKETKYRKLMAEKPEFAVRHAVVGMLPKGPLGRQMAKKLKIYAGAEHDQAAQKPEVLDLK